MAKSQWQTAAAGSQVFRRCYSAEATQEENTPSLSVEDMMPVENIRNIAIIGASCDYLLSSEDGVSLYSLPPFAFPPFAVWCNHICRK